MKTIIWIALLAVGVFLFRKWSSITDKKRPYDIPIILKRNSGLVFFGYVVFTAVIVYSLWNLSLVSLFFPLAFFVIYIVLRKFVNKNNTVDSQINWINKMYEQERKMSSNQEKTDEELMMITAKRYLGTMGWSSRYYLLEENPPKDLGDLIKNLIC